jgi:hypothetical protein
MITDSNHACFSKMATCGFQEGRVGEGGYFFPPPRLHSKVILKGNEY